MPVSSHIIPSPHVIRMPYKMPPFTFLIWKMAVIRSPMTASNAQIPFVWKSSVKLVIVTRVEASTLSPAFCRPINAINKPIPTETPFFKVSGIALKIASRTFVSDMIMNTIPSTNTANNAICQDNPIPCTTV